MVKVVSTDVSHLYDNSTVSVKLTRLILTAPTIGSPKAY